jgi:hypothetical protein
MAVNPRVGIMTVTASKHFPTRAVNGPVRRMGLRSSFVAPIQITGQQRRPLHWILDIPVLVGSPSFQQQNAIVRIFRQTRRKDASGGTGANNDVIVGRHRYEGGPERAPFYAAVSFEFNSEKDLRDF